MDPSLIMYGPGCWRYLVHHPSPATNWKADERGSLLRSSQTLFTGCLCCLVLTPHPPPDLQKLLKNTDWSHGPGAMLTLKHFLQVVGEINEKMPILIRVFFIFKIMEIPYSRIFLHLPLSYILHIMCWVGKSSLSHFTSQTACLFWGRDVLQ